MANEVYIDKPLDDGRSPWCNPRRCAPPKTAARIPAPARGHILCRAPVVMVQLADHWQQGRLPRGLLPGGRSNVCRPLPPCPHPPQSAPPPPPTHPSNSRRDQSVGRPALGPRCARDSAPAGPLATKPATLRPVKPKPATLRPVKLIGVSNAAFDQGVQASVGACGQACCTLDPPPAWAVTHRGRGPRSGPRFNA
jgi:hypothetical protein